MNEEKESNQIQPDATPEGEEALAVQDLLVDEGADVINQYLSLSITNDGQNTVLSATTVQGEPVVYTTTFYGMTAENLQSLLNLGGLESSDSGC
jgi:hypothetical protein